MADAQAVDVGVVGQALLGEVLTEVVVVGANGLGELRKGEVVLQVKLRVVTMTFKQLSNAGGKC